jgi:hypothetical protein
MLARLEVRARPLHSLLDHLHQIDRTFFEHNHAARDAGHIEEVIDKLDHFLKLAVHDHLGFSFRFLSCVTALP